jgi:hypothetical protein
MTLSSDTSLQTMKANKEDLLKLGVTLDKLMAIDTSSRGNNLNQRLRTLVSYVTSNVTIIPSQNLVVFPGVLVLL